MQMQMDKWLSYDFPTAVRNRFTGTISRFQGQTQKWYASLCLGFLSGPPSICKDSHTAWLHSN